MALTVVKANTLTAASFILRQGGESPKPVSLAGKTVKVLGKASDYTAWIAEAITGVTAEPTFNFTADATTDLLTHVGHRVKEGQEIILSSTGTLPAGLSTSPVFAVQVTQNAFAVASVPNGAPINITDTGSGTHSYYRKGHVIYDWQTADVANAGTFRLYFNVYSGSEYDTFPIVPDGTHNQGFTVYVVEPA